MSKLAHQYFENPRNYKDKTRQRIYLKDIDCPQVWHDKLQEQMPASLFYLNESTGEAGGPGATVDAKSSVPGRRLGRGIARAGDLMSNLPPEMRAENLMCYIGHEGTYTPSHREMCATMGHNIMVEASTEVGENGKPEKPGSSIWFMTESKDRNTVSEYFLSVLGHDIEVENHFAQVSAWKKAPFNVYVVEQKPGDFILVPPLAPHQVWNRGTRTMKVAWNRTTVETLDMALTEALPKARIVCRDEQYKNKAIVYYSLMKYSSLLASAKSQADRLSPDASRAMMSSHKIKQLAKDFKRLLGLFKDIMLSEMFSPDGPQEKCEFLPFDSNVTCAYCRGNIFNRFLSCPSCKDNLGHTDEEPYDVCMDCYAMGRSCGCISNLKWNEQFKWRELTQKYESWRKQVIDLDGGRVSSKTPLALADERKNLPRKTLAEVCKEQLKKRPFVDLNKPKEKGEEDESEEDIIVDDEGRVKKTVKKRSKKWLNTHSPCHVCCKRHPNWKSAKCTTCERWWCYGSLFRGADMMPQSIMEDPNWSCPHCKGVCFAGACRKDSKQNPYEPKGTLLGHDTKKIADARSVECLVDFSVSNLTWLRDDEDAVESARIRRAREEAQRAKDVDPQIEDDEDREDVEETQVNFEYSPDGTPMAPSQRRAINGQTEPMALDPALQDESDLLQSLSDANKALPRARSNQRSSHLPTDGNPSNSYVPDGYAPAMTSGFVAPSAVMYQQIEDNTDYAYPDPEAASRPAEDGDDYQPQGSKFRPFKRPSKHTRESEEDDTINMNAHPKKRRISDHPSLALDRPRNEATKQFEKEKEKKALDEAKKQGRFIAVQAALKGRRRVVKLPIPGARLAQLVARQAANQLQPASIAPAVASGQPQEETILLRSDIAPAKEKARMRASSNKMKVRVEKDEDYGVRGDRHQRMEAKRKRNPGVDYEEVDIASDDEDEVIRGTSKSKDGTDGRRRISSYIQRKHQDDPDLPDELPENFKDSRPGRNTTMPSRPPRLGPFPRSKVTGKFASNAAAPSPATATATERPAEAPRKPTAVSKTRIDISDDDDKSEEEDEADGSAGSDTLMDSDMITTEEANRRAKLEALSMLEANSPATSIQGRTPAANPGSNGRRSILDSKGKKNVKISSGAAPKKSKIITKGGMHVDSESESDGPDVIPARAPVRRGLNRASPP